MLWNLAENKVLLYIRNIIQEYFKSHKTNTISSWTCIKIPYITHSHSVMKLHFSKRKNSL